MFPSLYSHADVFLLKPVIRKNVSESFVCLCVFHGEHNKKSVRDNKKKKRSRLGEKYLIVWVANDSDAKNGSPFLEPF